MRLSLHYRGSLRSNGGPAHKHDLRRHFHRQLRTLWHQLPLSELSEYFLIPRKEGEYSFLRPRGDFVFVPLVVAEAHTIAELSVVILRPEPPGNLITQGGDIDNRLKTLFDALTMPPQPNALPASITPEGDELPYFYCLLEDDNLVTSVAVRTEQLLEPDVDASIVDVTISVRTRVTRPTMGNDAFS